MGWFKSVFHPNRVDREECRKAEEQRREVSLQAAAEVEKANQRKQESFTAIDAACTTAISEVDSWYQEKISSATSDYTDTQTKYNENLAQLEQSYKAGLESIENGFQLEQDKIQAAKSADEQAIRQCSKSVIGLADKREDYYGYHNHVLEQLWQQVQEDMLHSRCRDAYEELKSDNFTSGEKNKSYTLLLGYFRQLLTQEVIEKDQFSRYSKFLHALYKTSSDIEINHSFKIVDEEILSTLDKVSTIDKKTSFAAFEADSKSFKNKYSEAKEFHSALNDKVLNISKDILEKHDKSLADLKLQYESKKSSLLSKYNEVKLDIENNRSEYQSQYDTAIESIEAHKTTKTNDVERYRAEEKAKVEAQHNSVVADIEKEVKEKHKKIDDDLDDTLKQLKRSYRATIINGLVAIAAAVTAVYTFPLSVGGGGMLIDAFNTIILGTGVAATNNCVKRRDKFEAKGQINFGYAPHSNNLRSDLGTESTRFNNHMPQNHNINLESIQNRFQEFTRNVQTWQQEAEHDLFYRLDRGISLPRTNFSEAMTSFSSHHNMQRPAFSWQASLGPLQDSGYRTIDLGLGSSTNARWLMRDSDIRSTLHNMHGASLDLFGNNWDGPQVFQFQGSDNSTSSIGGRNTNYQFEGNSQSSVSQDIPKSKIKEERIARMKLVTGYVAGAGKSMFDFVVSIPSSLAAAQKYGDPMISSAAAVHSTMETLEEQVSREYSYIQNSDGSLERFMSAPIDITLNVVNEHFERRSTLYNYHMSQGRYFDAGYSVGESDFRTLEVTATVATLGYAGGVGLCRAAPRLVSGIGRTSALVSDYVAANRFQSPIVVQYEAGRLNLGIPIDSVKLRKPVVGKFTKLDWSRISPRTGSDAAHHVLSNHFKIKFQKVKQDLFYSNPIVSTEEAWLYAQQKGILPSLYRGKDYYVVPRFNSGYASGMSGQLQNMDYITIVTKSKTNKVITAFPSGRTPPLPNDYTFNLGVQNVPKP